MYSKTIKLRIRVTNFFFIPLIILCLKLLRKAGSGFEKNKFLAGDFAGIRQRETSTRLTKFSFPE